MNQTSKNRRLRIAIPLILSFLFVAFSNNSVFANYWDDDNTTGGGGSCGSSSATLWWDTCFGGAWEYYEYVNGWTGEVRIYGASSDKYGATISSICGEVGGFWSRGMIAYNPSKSGIGARIDGVGDWRKRQQVGSLSYVGSSEIGIIQASTLASAGIDRPYSKAKKGSGSFTSNISDSEVGARAVKYGNTSEVQAALQDAHAAGLTEKTELGTTSAFCWSEGLKGAKQDGKVTAKANGSTGTVTVDSDTFTFTADHYISRTDKQDKTFTTPWSYTGKGGNGNGNITLKPSDGWKKAGGTATKTVASPGLGETKEYCSTLTYASVINNDGTVKTNGTAKGCVTVYRKVSTSFTAQHSCSVSAAGESKGSQCDRNYDTNSKTWSISHSAWINSNYTSGYTVPASTTGGGASPYNFSAQKYGVAVQCARSKNPYTQFWWSAYGGVSNSGPTLRDTGSKDMPAGYSGNNKYFYGYTDWYDCDCEYVGTGEYDKNGKEKKKRVCHDRCRDEIWKYRYDGCGSGTTNWYDFSKSTQSKTWSESNDSVLKLPENSSIETVSIARRTSTMKAEGKYMWNGAMTNSSAWNQITRWRRHVHFRQGTTTFKADTNKDNNKTVATTARSDGYDLNVTNSNGRFIVTLSYAIDRTTTDNVKDTGAEHLTVKNQWYSKETIDAADGSGQIYKVNHEKVDGATYGAYGVYRNEGEFSSSRANTNNVAGPKTHTISGMLYYGQKIKICGMLKYGDKVRELENGSEIEHWTESKTNCITIHRDEKTCDNIPASNISPSTTPRTLDHQEGYNIAVIGAENITTGISSPYYTIWNHNSHGRTDTGIPTERTVWARPGDNIRYTVNYCMGANYAHVVHLADDRPISGGRDTTLKMAGDSVARRDVDTTKVNAIRRSHYLFGDTVSSLSGADAATNKTIATIFNFTKKSDGSFDPSIATNDANYIGEKKSPDGVGTRYSCPNGGGASGASNYYQIAGKVKNSTGEYRKGAAYDKNGNGTDDNYSIDGCGTNRTQSLDVGRELSESLFWTNMRVYTSGGVTQAQNRADYYAKANVRIPYNYTAKPFLKNNSKPTGTVQIGGKLMTTPGIAVFPRKNCAFISGYEEGLVKDTTSCAVNNSIATYATVTKPTTVTFTSYYIDNGGTQHTFKNESIVVRSNTKSNLSGAKAGGTYSDGRGNAGGPQLDSDYVVDIPNNVAPGNRVCIRMTISPADSHSYLGSNPVFGASIKWTDREYTDNANKTFWALREDGTTTAYAVSCSTAVKRPTISAEDSNLYSASQTVTSVVTRRVGTDDSGEGIYRLFGSWSEYGLFSKVMTGTTTDSVSSLGTASGASYGYSQGGYGHYASVSGFNAQPLTVVTYNKGPKNGTFKYNYKTITSAASQYNIVYNWVTKADGTHEYVLQSKNSVTIQPSKYTFANSPVVNSTDLSGSAPSNTKVCNHATQTFANINCDSASGGIIGSDKVGADAAKTFYDSIIDRYGNEKMDITKTVGAGRIGSYIDLTDTKAVAEQFDDTNDENSALYKNIGSNKGFLGYASGADINLANLSIKSNGNAAGIDLGLTAKSVLVYKADTIVINSSILANTDEKTGPGDFRMPIIIANKVWFTGTPKRIDAIIIAKEELNTCKWNDYSSFLNNTPVKYPQEVRDSYGNFIKWSNANNEMNSNLCSNELRFTAPVIVKGRLILNRTSGAGAGGDQIRRAELFELNPATYLWSFHEMSRYSQATTTYSRELPTRY